MVACCCVVGCNSATHDRHGKRLENGLTTPAMDETDVLVPLGKPYRASRYKTVAYIYLLYPDSMYIYAVFNIFNYPLFITSV